MFKLLYKTLLITVMSCSLMTLNMDFAFAQATTTNSTWTRDANGNLTKTATANFTGTADSDDTTAWNIVMMLVIGTVGAKLLTYTKWTPDMSMVAIGSTAYLVGEILNIANMKDQMSSLNQQFIETTDTSNKAQKTKEAQIDALQKLKDSYKKARESLEQRESLEHASLTLFEAAAVTATYNAMTLDGTFATCTAGTASAIAALGTCFTEQTALAAKLTAAAAETLGGTLFFAQKATAEAVSCSACATAVTAFQSLLVSVEAKTKVPGFSAEKALVITPADSDNEVLAVATCAPTIAAGIKSGMVTSACTGYLTSKVISQSYGAASLLLQNKSINPKLERLLFPSFLNSLDSENMLIVDQSAGYKKMLEKVLDVFIPKAEANYLSLFGLVPGVYAAFGAATKAFSLALDKMLFDPGGRVVAWMVMSIMTEAQLQNVSQQKGKIDENIAKIDKILNDMNTLAKDGTTTDNPDPGGKNRVYLPLPPMTSVDRVVNKDPKVKTDCLTADCNSLPTNYASMPEIAGLPGGIGSLYGSAMTLGNGLSNTNKISGSTMATANSIGAQSNAIKKLMDQMKAKYNDSLTKAGKPAIDFDKVAKDTMNKFKSDVAGAFKSKGVTPGAFLAGMGISSASASVANVAATSKSAGAKKVASPSIFGGAPAPKGLDFNFKEKAAAGDVAKDSASKLDGLELGSNDIHTDSGESIFKLISDRYFKSGYPKLLEEIPAAPAKK